MEPETQQTQTGEGSLRFLSRKSSDYSVSMQCIGMEIEAYPKTRRYAQLQLANMFASLVELYVMVFEVQWSYFRRVAENLGEAAVPQAEQRLNIARVYISHWILDLYANVEKRTPVAFTEYDVFLAHLNSCIRPTHVVGCYEDSMFIPKFADTLDMSNNNPFDIPNFTVNFAGMNAIVRAIKDKRAGWRTARLSNETVGRPFWLFDWHSEDRVCSWFPRAGNYTNEDLLYAYLIGVACTPTMAHSDCDQWQKVADDTNWERYDVSLIRRMRERRYFGAYEVDTYSHRDETFQIYPEDQETVESQRERPNSTTDG